MNALQQLIAGYLADHPGETYASISRRGNISKSTVHSLATKDQHRQTPHKPTLAGLARGMNMPEQRVRQAAAIAAGYEGEGSVSEGTDDQGRLIIIGYNEMDPKRKADLSRRMRMLLEEMREEGQAND